MIIHPRLNVLMVREQEAENLALLTAYLAKLSHVRITSNSKLSGRWDHHDVIVTDQACISKEESARLARFTETGGGWLTVTGMTPAPLDNAFGTQPSDPGPEAELRVMFHDAAHPMAARLPDCVYIHSRHQPLRLIADDVRCLLDADWHYSRTPVLVYRQYGDGRLACTTLQDFSNPVMHQIIHRLLQYLAGQPAPSAELGVGILGYAPSVGRAHGICIEHTPGIRLHAVCDVSADRIAQACRDFPGLCTYASAADLAGDPRVDLVIVATPPNTHAELSLQMMAAGKHVLCEKPLALTCREADAMTAMSTDQGVHLSCHQNRRWDPDFLAIRQAVDNDLIGDPFYLETFVGGFTHPCGYWHSHAPVSGGTAYDWGAHYIDWIVGLIPDPVTAVSGSRHKRVWHDVSNADQERIQIYFANGQEAEFIHSDIAAASKPKWYVLGTRGAITGTWRGLTALDTDPDFYFHQEEIPRTETVPDITLFQYHSTGQIVQMKPAVPQRNIYRFHENLTDHLAYGEPLAAPLTDSVKVVSILEAAARSMDKGGTREVFHE